MNCRGQQGKLMLLHCPAPGDADVLEVGSDDVKRRTLLRALQRLLLLAEAGSR